MAEPTGGNSLDALWQALTAAGVFVGGVIAALLGVRKKIGSSPDQSAAELRAQLAVSEMQRDLSEAFQAHREAMEGRMRDFEGGIHAKIDGLSDERRREMRSLEERVRQIEIGRHK